MKRANDGRPVGRVERPVGPEPVSKPYRLDRVLAELCAMHDKPSAEFGWMEQTTLHDAVLLLQEMRGALQWYATEAEAIARNVLAQNTTSMLASMQVLALDAGERADVILRPNAEAKPTAACSEAEGCGSAGATG